LRIFASNDKDLKEMTVTVQDTIERQLVIPVGRQRVWEAITAPDQIAAWFSDTVTMELEPGSPIVFHWDGYGDRRGQVETVDPHNRFAYRWIPTDETDQSIPFDEVPSTLVEYTLEETSEGTRVTVTESGFSRLPADVREQMVRGNTEGWIMKTTALLDYLVADGAR
jgi:uncharacterized protein YndB with AHSA1/START domain